MTANVENVFKLFGCRGRVPARGEQKDKGRVFICFQMGDTGIS